MWQSKQKHESLNGRRNCRKQDIFVIFVSIVLFTEKRKKKEVGRKRQQGVNVRIKHKYG